MADKFHWSDTTSVSRDGVTVERELEGRDDGIIVTLDLHADVSGPLRVEVSDEFPADLPAEQAGFNVEHEPDDGDLSLERAEIRHTVEDEPARIVYAIRLSAPVGPVEFEDPVIEDVTLPGLSAPDPAADEDDDPPDAATDTAGEEPVPFDSSAFEPTVPADRASEPSPDDAGAVDGTESPPGDPEGDRDGGRAGDAGVDEGPPIASESGGGDGDPVERAIAESERSGASGPEEGGRGADRSTDPSDADADRGDDGATAGAAAPDDGPRMGSGHAPPGSSGPGGQGSSERVAGAESDIDSPEGEPGTGRASDRPPAGAPGGPQAGEDAEPAPADEISRSVRLRLDRLNARVEEFATYAEALEDIIEREGTGPEIIENLERNLSDANERLEEVRTDVDSLQSEHSDDVSAVRERIDALEDELEDARSDLKSDIVNVRGTVDDVGADVERVDAETTDNAEDVEEVRNHLETVESAVHSLDDRVDDYEDGLEDVGETVESVQSEVSELSESVDAMRSDVESLQVDVERLLRFREILADVFGGPVQRATEDDREPGDRSGGGTPADGGSLSTPSEPSD